MTLHGRRLPRLIPCALHHVYADRTAGHGFMRVRAAAGPLSLRDQARVEVRRPASDAAAVEWLIHQLTDNVLHNLRPMHYCESNLLTPVALQLFGALPPGVDYRLGSSDTTTTACDVFMRRAGVCHDFSHLVVAFCRATQHPR